MPTNFRRLVVRWPRCKRIVACLAFALALLLPAALAQSATSLADVKLPTLTPEMVQYSRTRYAIYFASIAYGLVMLFVVMQAGLSTKMRDIANRLTKFYVLQIAIYSVLFCLLIFVMSFPLAYFSSFWIEHSYHLSSQSLLDWLGDKGKSLMVSMLMTTIGYCIFFGLVRKFPKHWPILLWLIMVPLTAVTTFAEPLIVDPLFNKFTAMQDGSLRTKILELADKAKIPNAVILVADKSKQTNKLNAYVTGIGGSSRIVLWDSTIATLPEDQTLAVVGHEIGHYVMGHVYWDFLLISAFTFLSVPINYLLARRFVRALPAKWNITGLDDCAVAPVLLAVSIAAGFVLSPGINAWSRYQEHQADAFGLNLTDNKLAMANLFITFAQKNLTEPDPPAFIKFWLYTHPTLKERIEFAAGHSVN